MRRVPGYWSPPPNGMVQIWWPSPRSGKGAPKSQILVQISEKTQPKKGPRSAPTGPMSTERAKASHPSPEKQANSYKKQAK